MEMNDTGSGFTIRLGRTSRKQFSYQDVERMNMKDYIFPYGSGTVTLSLEETRVLGVLKGHDSLRWTILEKDCMSHWMRRYSRVLYGNGHLQVTRLL